MLRTRSVYKCMEMSEIRCGVQIIAGGKFCTCVIVSKPRSTHRINEYFMVVSYFEAFIDGRVCYTSPLFVPLKKKWP